MKCSRAQRLWIEFEDVRHPPELAEHLASCAACRRQHEREQTLRKLVSLKQYEMPRTGLEQRTLAGVHERIEQLKGEPENILAKLWELLTGSPLPVFRYAAAGAFALLLVVHLFAIPPLPASLPLVEKGRASLAAQSTAPVLGSPAQVTVMTDSNAGSRVDYGPYEPSRPVNLEY